MTNLSPRLSKLSSCLFFLTLMVSPCFAALGGDVVSVQNDQARMRAQRQVTQRVAYSLHEMQDDSGITVREFVSPKGKVFGVAWEGPNRPDLQQVLGSYYRQLLANLPRQRLHGPISISVGGFVIQSGGHQRWFTGRAFVPEMVPSGVIVEEIQ